MPVKAMPEKGQISDDTLFKMPQACGSGIHYKNRKWGIKAGGTVHTVRTGTRHKAR